MHKSKYFRERVAFHKKRIEEQVTPSEAKKIVKNWLAEHGLSARGLSARTVGFSDLARGAAVFVTVRGFSSSNPDDFRALKEFAKASDFLVEFE